MVITTLQMKETGEWNSQINVRLIFFIQKRGQYNKLDDERARALDGIMSLTEYFPADLVAK